MGLELVNRNKSMLMSEMEDGQIGIIVGGKCDGDPVIKSSCGYLINLKDGSYCSELDENIKILPSGTVLKVM